MTRKALFSAVVVFGLAVASSAWAVTANGTINQVTVTQNGEGGNGPWVIVTVTGSSSTAGCATFAGFVIDSSGVSGQALAAAVFSAKDAGRTVTMVGSNTCDISGVYEDLAYIRQ